ncbi:MAG: tail fiber domain-containing protein [Verrucomicrobiales bacterium]|nr:tail fiber domain-containing protein [Verrucomicrobiales bacterium]
MKTKLLSLLFTVVCLVPSLALAQGAWRLNGNSGTTPGLNFLGTTDNQPVEFKVNGDRAFRLEYGIDPNTGNYGPNVIGGFRGNYVAPGVYGATIAGGGVSAYWGTSSNVITGHYSSIGGGGNNSIGTHAASIAGGTNQKIETNAPGAGIAGGDSNIIRAGSKGATIAGGESNVIERNSSDATIGGGFWNGIGTGSVRSTIAGGERNSIGPSASYNHIGGGLENAIREHAELCAIAGGERNAIHTSARRSYIGGGAGNLVDSNADTSIIGGGSNNRVLPGVSGATVPGGAGNVAGHCSFAAGYHAHALHNGTFVWGDFDQTDTKFTSTDPNQFLIRASGGVGIGKNNPQAQLDVAGSAAFSGNVGIGTTSPQAKLDVTGDIRATGTVITQVLELLSDREAKDGFQVVDAREVLKKVITLPISTWQYKTTPDVRHIGPMAQDFKAAFDVGSDEKHIATIDADGVAFAAIQGLHELLREKDEQIATLRRQLVESKMEIADAQQSLSIRLAALEKGMSRNILQASFQAETNR